MEAPPVTVMPVTGGTINMMEYLLQGGSLTLFNAFPLSSLSGMSFIPQVRDAVAMAIIRCEICTPPPPPPKVGMASHPPHWPIMGELRFFNSTPPVRHPSFYKRHKGRA
ncbi:mediator of RNA polymerase II transcription subunit 18 [Clarias magur]|uniref:Mediator of RNA polymerase II transcription subunit 18 n=1 Tax=Clarias magur TaxID=1594786 RepID=A0A8J4UKG9_CLAMG|nr:mediator of RNA polymerase II transcription subunit 18 [Clarias magur]